LKNVTALQTSSLVNTDTSNSVIKHGRGVTVSYNTFLSVGLNLSACFQF